MKLWSKKNSHSLLVGVKNGIATLEDRQFLTKLDVFLPYDPAIAFLGIYLKELKTYVNPKTCTQMLIIILFIIAKTSR